MFLNVDLSTCSFTSTPDLCVGINILIQGLFSKLASSTKMSFVSIPGNSSRWVTWRTLFSLPFAIQFHLYKSLNKHTSVIYYNGQLINIYATYWAIIATLSKGYYSYPL